MKCSCKQRYILILIATILVTGLGLTKKTYSQTQRNPVLEFCTGTWCQWCPCGDSLIINDILPAIPNAIILAYHGAGSDPFRIFHGNSILSSLGLNAYPTGVVDRVTGVISRSVWLANMNTRLSTPATVSIDVNRSYDPVTREFNAVLQFTALENLSGNYRFKVILVEDGQVWSQTSNFTCTPGQGSIPNYVHEWLVRDIMTGASGQTVINGAWNQNQVVESNFVYTVPVPTPPAPDIIPDSCSIVVMVYQQGSPLNSNAEIQQAVELPLISPDYAGVMSAQQSGFLGNNTDVANTSVVIKNEGLLTDRYYIQLSFTGPAGWIQSFTTTNGTFFTGQIDSLDVASGDSAVIDVAIDPNSITGYGKTKLEFWSQNSPSTFGSVVLRFATYGLDILVVDDEKDDHEKYMEFELENQGADYGVVPSSLIPGAGTNINSFNSLIWMCALTFPTVNPDEVNILSSYLDNGGNLYLNGVDIAYELADPASPYHTTASEAFFTNYLHADYIKRIYSFLMVDGVPGDPITGNLSAVGLFGGTGASTINFTTGTFPNQIDTGDPNASPIFSFIAHPNDICGIRAIHNGTSGIGGVVFTTFGFETLADSTHRALYAQQLVSWFHSVSAIDDQQSNGLPDKFLLKQNYPNPFNPLTTISYVLPATTGKNEVSLVIYNQLGQKVRTLVKKVQTAGFYEAVWNGLDDGNRQVATGIYLYQLRYGDFKATKKMLLLR